MKILFEKPIWLLVALFTSMTLTFTACEDDDGPQINDIQIGEIPAKNLYITIDGTFIHGRTGKTQISGTIDPDAAEQHLQLSTETMIMTYPGDQYMWIIGFYPVFDITISGTGAKREITGRYEGYGYIISLTGEITVNYNGDNDWRLDIRQEQIFSDTMKDVNKFLGKTLVYDFNEECTYLEVTNPIHNPNRFPEEGVREINKKLIEAYMANSGYSGVKISFIDSDDFELWFKKSDTGEYVKDNSGHKYMLDSTNGIIYFIDEKPFIQKLANDLDLQPAGIGYAMEKEFCFANERLQYDSNSSNLWYVTRFNYKMPWNSSDVENGAGYLTLNTLDGSFLNGWYKIPQNIYLPNNDLFEQFYSSKGYIRPTMKVQVFD